MNLETLRSFLLWSGIINYAFLAFWGVLMLTSRGGLHKIGRWYGLSDEQFDLIQYAGLVFYKVCIFMFFLIPYVALRMIG